MADLLGQGDPASCKGKQPAEQTFVRHVQTASHLTSPDIHQGAGLSKH